MTYQDKVHKALTYTAKGYSDELITSKLRLTQEQLIQIRKENPDKIRIMQGVLKIRDLKDKGKFYDALKMCDLPEYCGNDQIEAQRVSIIIKEHEQGLVSDLEEAHIICNNPLFSDSDIIEAMKVALLIYEYNAKLIPSLREAEHICNTSRFRERRIFKQLTDRINRTYRSPLRPTEPKISTYKIKNLDQTYYPILIRIKEYSITLEEINNSNLSPWAITILTIAFYIRNNYPKKTILQYLQSVYPTYQNYPEALKLLSNLQKYAEIKRNLFDIDYFQTFLHYNFNIESERIELLSTKETLNAMLDPKKEPETPPSIK